MSAETDLRTIAAQSPVFQMIDGVDAPDGAVCGIDGVCVVPGESAGAGDSGSGSSSTRSTTK